MGETSTFYRTHTCGELRMEQVGQTVTLAGWMENLREVGQNLAFLVLRDFYGTTQIVLETEETVQTAKELNKETVISVTGVVRERDSKNPKLPTGDIEVVPAEIKVLGRCRHNELPFPVTRSREADESARLKYRYLDLRNPEVKDNIVLRCQVVSALRAAMTGEGTSYADLTYTVELNSEEYGVGFRKGSDLAAALNEFFKASYADGSMQQIADTYKIGDKLVEQK